MKVDKARKFTDKKLSKMIYRLMKIYKEADAGMRAKLEEYLKALDKQIPNRIQELQAAIASGDAAAIKKAQEVLRDTILHQTPVKKIYDDMILQTAERMSNTNETALKYINGELPPIYAQNYNQIGNNIQAAVQGYSFDIVNEQTVRQLTVLDKQLMLPPKKIDRVKDVKWNTRTINNQILQGIIQGESVGQMADRLTTVTNMNRAAAVRNARTMVTAAENRGRLAGMEQAESNGVVLKKQWMSTHDNRTRDTHAAIDGQMRDPDKPFSNGLLYPGDYAGAPSEVYNCRCTMVTQIIGYRNSDGTISYVGDIDRYSPTYFKKEGDKK